MNLNVRGFREPFLRRLFKSDQQKIAKNDRTKISSTKKNRYVSGKMHIAGWLPSPLYHTPVPERLTRGSRAHAAKEKLPTSLHLFARNIHPCVLIMLLETFSIAFLRGTANVKLQFRV